MIRVKAAFVSLTPPAAPDDDGSYLRWHLLDHQPEQYQLPGMLLSLRYVADGDLLTRRIAGDGPLADVGNMVNYLVGDPVQQTHDEFMELGVRLAEKGRFPEVRPSLQLRMPALLHWYAAPAALVSAEVVPWRPHRGVVLVVEEPVGEPAAVAGWLQWLHAEHHPNVLATPGVAGAWMFGETTTWDLHAVTAGPPQHTTVIYVDGDLAETADRLAPLLAQRWSSGAARAQFAGPLRTMVRWDAWP